VNIGLALSGGGSRAIAFHLGCLRALEQRGILARIPVISAVSGGAVIASMYAYRDENFVEFDHRVVQLLRRGLHRSVFQQMCMPSLAARVLATNVFSWPLATLAKLIRRPPPFRRWASRSDALEHSIQKDILGDVLLGNVARRNLDVVFNACELRTGTAFRFGNHRSGSWRTGEIQGNRITVAHAVACSAAYPMFLPAFDRTHDFVKDGQTSSQRVVIADGGIYDNLGTTCLEPGRDESKSLHAYQVDYLICCYAGHGQFDGRKIPYGMLSRTEAAFETVFRKVQDATMNRLHLLKQASQIKGFILPYLGQQDGALPLLPPDLVRRDEVLGYPTNFAAMHEKDIWRLSSRGEQLTRILLSHYCPEL
jgi:NTE family protein